MKLFNEIQILSDYDEVLTLVKAHAPRFSPSRVDPTLTQREGHLIKGEGD